MDTCENPPHESVKTIDQVRLFLSPVFGVMETQPVIIVHFLNEPVSGPAFPNTGSLHPKWD